MTTTSNEISTSTLSRPLISSVYDTVSNIILQSNLSKCCIPPIHHTDLRSNGFDLFAAPNLSFIKIFKFIISLSTVTSFSIGIIQSSTIWTHPITNEKFPVAGRAASLAVYFLTTNIHRCQPNDTSEAYDFCSSSQYPLTVYKSSISPMIIIGGSSRLLQRLNEHWHSTGAPRALHLNMAFTKINAYSTGEIPCQLPSYRYRPKAVLVTVP